MIKLSPINLRQILLNQAGWYLRERGQYAEAEPFSKRALTIRERVSGPEHEEVSNSLATMSELLTLTQFNLPGTLFRASQFLSEELPIRLAHRVEELGHLPDGLNEMPSIKKVQDWYAQSFEVWTRETNGPKLIDCILRA